MQDMENLFLFDLRHESWSWIKPCGGGGRRVLCILYPPCTACTFLTEPSSQHPHHLILPVIFLWLYRRALKGNWLFCPRYRYLYIYSAGVLGLEHVSHREGNTKLLTLLGGEDGHGLQNLCPEKEVTSISTTEKRQMWQPTGVAVCGRGEQVVISNGRAVLNTSSTGPHHHLPEYPALVFGSLVITGSGEQGAFCPGKETQDILWPVFYLGAQ